MIRATLCVLALVALFTMSSIAQATYITADGSAIFDANGFESDTVGALPSVTTPSGTSWAVATVGDAVYPGDAGQVSVEAAGVGGVPSATPGSQLLKLNQPNDPNQLGSPIARAEAVFASPISSGTVKAKYSIYIDSAGHTQTGGNGAHMMADFTTAANPDNFWGNRYTMAGWAFQGGDIAGMVSTTGIGANDMLTVAYNGSGYQNVTKVGGGNMYMSPDAWHSVEMDLNVGSNYTLTIDGVASNPINLAGSDLGPSVAGFVFHANVGDRSSLAYVDAYGTVPEPSAVVLLLSGLIGLLAYAWKKRR